MLYGWLWAVLLKEAITKKVISIINEMFIFPYSWVNCFAWTWLIKKDIKLNLQVLGNIPRDRWELQVVSALCPTQQHQGSLHLWGLHCGARGQEDKEPEQRWENSKTRSSSFVLSLGSMLPPQNGSLHILVLYLLLGPGEQPACFSRVLHITHLPDLSSKLFPLYQASYPRVRCLHYIILNVDTYIILNVDTMHFHYWLKSDTIIDFNTP